MAPKKKLGEILISEGLIDDVQLRSAMGHQKNWGGKLGSSLVELGFITEEVIAKVLEGQLKQACLSEDKLIPEPSALAVMTMQEALRYNALPLRIEGNVLILAMSNPFDLTMTDEIGFKLGKQVRGVLAVEATIRKAIKRHYGQKGGRDARVDVKPVQQVQQPPAGKFEDSVYYGSEPGMPVFERTAGMTIDPSPVEKPKPEPSRRVEPSPDLISKAVAYLLIEKGIIRKEELVEKMKAIKEKGL